MNRWILILLIAMPTACSERAAPPNAEPATLPAAPPASSVPQAADPPTWRLHESVDNFTKTTSSYAGLVSSNTFEFSFPYQGQQHAVLFVSPQHYTDTHGLYYDISLKVEHGQFLCGPEPCVVRFRFDDGIFDNWAGRPLKDGSTNEITLGRTTDAGMNGSGCVYLELLHYKSLAVQAEFYQEGTRTFEFNIDGLDKLNFPVPTPKDAKDCTERLKSLKREQ